MDRQEMIFEKGKELLEPVFQGEMQEMMQDYKQQEEEILSSLCEKIQELFLLAERMQREETRGPITDLAVCYLLSSTLTGNYEIRMDLYDKDFYLDEEECCVYWEPEFLTRYLKKDMESFKKGIRMRIPRIRAYEMQRFMDAHRNDYMLILMIFFRQMLPEIFGRMDAYRVEDVEVDQEKFRVIFGEYMGNCEVLYGEGGEEA